ncbi:unnamed protein product [Allacma fusca]|uniref:Uncharacterized protein n=1 Tax=Allacma fusca TaxID=39272 RepID=A0A8J2K0N8_9HEXA|nr:unnamed protein product [Allacma fusca]
MLVIFHPMYVYTLVVLFPLIFLFDSSATLFWYSMIPPRFNHIVVFVGFIFFETAIVTTFTAAPMFALFLQLLFFQNISTTVSSHLKIYRCSEYVNIPEEQMILTLNVCKTLQLEVQNFNEIFSDVIFTFKVAALTVNVLASVPGICCCKSTSSRRCLFYVYSPLQSNVLDSLAVETLEKNSNHGHQLTTSNGTGPRKNLIIVPHLELNSPESEELGFVPFTLIDTRDDFLEMMADTNQQQIISLDYEFPKEHSYYGSKIE